MSDTAVLTLTQVLLPLLSVPLLASAVSALYRLTIPTMRLSARLSRDLAIFDKLPASAEKDQFERIIAGTLAQLNARYAPELAARRRQVWKAVGYIVVSLFGLAIATVAIIAGFALNPTLDPTFTVAAVAAGAALTALAATISQVSRTRESLKISELVQVSTHEAAEQLAFAWAEKLGIADLEASGSAADKGADFTSDRYVIEVKSTTRPVQADVIHALVRIASAGGKRAILLATGDVTRSAIQLADESQVALLRFDGTEILGLNALGARVAASGADAAFADD